MEREITCPSGLKGVIRSIKVKDEQLYTDIRLVKSGQLPAALLGRCWLRAIDPGPYEMAEDGKLDWSRVLQGDEFYAIMQLRILSYGKDYEFAFGCEACRRSVDTVYDLEELPVKELPEESKTKLQNGEAFLATVGGKKVAFRLLRVEDAKMIRMLRDNRGVTGRQAALIQRIVELEGTHNTPPEITRFVEGLEASEFADLEALAESVDCGIETEISVDCRHCFYPTRLLLPFETFFSSRKRSSSASRATTGSSA